MGILLVDAYESAINDPSSSYYANNDYNSKHGLRQFGLRQLLRSLSLNPNNDNDINDCEMNDENGDDSDGAGGRTWEVDDEKDADSDGASIAGRPWQVMYSNPPPCPPIHSPPMWDLWTTDSGFNLQDFLSMCPEWGKCKLIKM